MHQQHRSSVSVKERVSASEQPHDFAETLVHLGLVLTNAQSFVDGQARCQGVREKNLALPHRAAGKRRGPILAGLGVVVREKNPVDFEKIPICQGLLFGEMCPRRVDVRAEEVVLEVFKCPSRSCPFARCGDSPRR